jgi:serine/threonine protein kinase
MTDVSTDTPITNTEWSADELIPFGKYVLLDRINSGATAAVYRANVRGEAGFERLVAIKRILPHMAGDRDFVDTFVREAKTVARLAHAGICPIYELGKVGESLYMAVEYVQGRDLGQIMRRLARRHESMPPIVAAYIAARLCDALDYAHTLKNAKGSRTGIIHRDLSPSNIVVSYEGQVKLIDFGLAKAVGRAQSTNVDALKQKLSYMSPEMVKGKPIDARSDLFGVGICLYEMITNRRLFAGENDIETLKLVGRASVPPPSAIVEDAPDELEIVAMRALEREPDDRYQNASEMGEALDAYLQHADPGYNSQRLATFMHDLFELDIEEEQKRIKKLLEASANVDLIKQRRMYFASPTGAAARARAEIDRRMSTEPPSIRATTDPIVPKAARIPQEARDADEEPTEFYDAEKTQATPLAITPGPAPFDEEPTEFYSSAPKNGSGGFEDEKTQFLVDNDIEDLGAAGGLNGTGGFDEEPTTIFFNKEDGIGIQELLDEVDAIEPEPGPLSRPIVAADALLAQPALQPLPAVFKSAPASMPAPTQQVRAMSLPAAAPRKRSPWPLIAASLVVAAAAALLVSKTSLGIKLGLRPVPSGTIDVRTTPNVLADVELDGAYRGHPPLSIHDVRPGLRQITVKADGYQNVDRQIAVDGGATVLLELTLVPEPPKPAPEPAAPAAGEAPNPAPAQPAQPAPRSASRDDGERESHRHRSSNNNDTSDDAPARDEREPSPREERAPSATQGTAPQASVPATTMGTLVVNTVPWSLVAIDGRDTGRTTPLLNYPIAPGVHQLQLRTATGQIHVERIEIKPGQTLSITRRY